jgi:hypothetical protein
MIEPEAIGNPTTHTFANGASYTFRELTLRQQGDIVAWIRSRRRQMALDFIGPNAKPDDRAAALTVAMKPLSPEDLQSELNSIDVMLHVLWISSDSSKRTPPIGPDMFADSLGVVSTEELVELLKIAQGITNEPEEAESGPNRPPIDSMAKGAS